MFKDVCGYVFPKVFPLSANLARTSQIKFIGPPPTHRPVKGQRSRRAWCALRQLPSVLQARPCSTKY